MKLKDAMQEQINRMSADEITETPPNTEIKNLLEAFVSLINAYLQRIGGSDNVDEEPGKKWPQVSKTFASQG